MAKEREGKRERESTRAQEQEREKWGGREIETHTDRLTR